MVNTPPPPAYEHEEYNHIVDYYDHTRDEDGPSASASSSAPVPSSNAAPPTQAPTLREGTMNGQAPRQTSLHEGDMLPAPGRPFMQLANRSTPSLPTHPRDPGFEHPPLPNNRHFPPPSSYDPNDLAFNSMHINDPIQRAGTSMSYRAGDPRADPIPRSGTSMSHRMPPPRGASAHPPAHYHPHPSSPVFDSASIYSGGSGGYSEYDQFDDRASIRSGHRGGYGDTMLPYGHYPRHPPPPGPYNRMPPPPPQDDGMYAAASFAGLDLPPGSAPPSLFIPPNPGAPYYPPPGPGGPGPSDGGGYLSPSQSSIMRGSSAASIRTDDTVAPTTKKIKAIDANQLPYTKEFVDQYRASMKEDPDPESHFKYAKYLIEAAKRIGEDAQTSEPLKVIRKLATTGDTFPDAQFFLANCYGTGMLGLQVDHEKAYHLYMQAAKQNHAAACYRVAVCNEIGAGTRKDPKHAFAFYKKAASLGDTAAMYKLGMIYLQGQLGQQKSPRDGVPWLRRAAEQADVENPHALHELGLLHEQPGSQVVVHDEAYAKDLFTRAAQLGFVRSQFKLGARTSTAAQKGDAEAELALSGWYLTGSEGVLKQSDSEAYLWARRAANKGLSKAEYAVGYYAEVGIGLKVDVEFAKRWYMRAAAQGNKRAMARLTDLKRAGNRRVAPGARPTRAQANNEDCVIA
ncbi:chitin synthase regulatory factor [Rhizoctonia solani]|uniref:Chitin synthase regulatory factor n=1 Tax=Rhizoctonia solani TaxID=456999 RepID=A0A8H8P995_9AGAM|nr:chitin synthase regulatory factor [Rhizoctonia solani]QRW26970.1 chitin synthase regulatory factor [Rhizoctonia solani]